MKKLDMQTPDLTEANIEKIAKLFPSVITEAEDDEGNLVRKVDFDLLRQELSKEIVEDTTERYRLDWPGKKRSLLKANTPIDKTLRPVPADSVNWDTTENLYLEGDNFEILKVLQESYLGKIKTIYIDPPYNTGKDFVYRDNFRISKDDYEEELGIKNEEGGKLFKNTDTNGRYHSDWLSMMYERLTIAKDLLKEDGIIFISIDDNEVTNLKKISDEVFGENNFIATLKWKKKKQPSFLSTVATVIEYIVVYAKDSNKINNLCVESLSDSDKPIINSSNALVERFFSSGIRVKKTDISKIEKGIYKNKSMTVEFLDDITIEDGRTKNSFRAISKFRNTQDLISKYVDSDLIFITKNLGFRRDLSEDEKGSGKTMTDLILDRGQNQDGSSELKQLFNIKEDVGIFDNPKPVLLIKNLVLSASNNDSIILDFFSGSATTAHAVMELNAEDGGNRKWIMVQLPEETDSESEAYKEGYKYITEIGKERIRRAGKKIIEDNKETLTERESELDIGFRVYKTDTTNMKAVHKHPSQISQDKLGLFLDNIKEDRTPEDLLIQVILDLGLTLDLPIESKKIKGNTVFFVAHNSLVACFDAKIDFAIVDEIAAIQPLKVVFRDSCFADDKDRINVETRMKRLSPDTIVSVI